MKSNFKADLSDFINMSIRTSALLAVMILSVNFAVGQDLGIKAPAQTGPIALVGGSIHTISDDVISDGYIVFDNGIITEIGNGQPAGSSEYEKVDITGLHVYPGIIHPYTQLGMKEISSLSDPTDVDEYGSETPEVRATVAVNPDSTVIPVSRSNGILLAGVFPTGGLMPGRAGMIRLDGWTTEDMTVLKSAGLVISWPRMRPVTASWMKESPEQQRKNSRKEIQQLKDYFDKAQAYYRAVDSGENISSDIRYESIRGIFPGESEAKPEQQVFVMAQDFDQIVSAIQVSRRYGWRLVVVGGEEAHLCMPLLKDNNVGVILLNTHRLPGRTDSDYDEAWKLPSILQEGGVRWCLGNREMFGNERNIAFHAGATVGHGLTRAQAMRSITLSVAEVFGIEKKYGSIEEGKSATLIVTTGSPLEILSDVRIAYIDGRQIDLRNKQTQLRDKYETKYRQQGDYPLKSVKP